MMNTTNLPPVLAAPGAGLPRIERFVANLMIHWKSRRTSRKDAAATFSRERGMILGLLGGREAAQLSERALIKRLPGLEDSSRYWSLLMVADHLRIVNEEITGVITCLTRGTLPERTADIAKVKPSGNVGVEVIAEFEKSCERFTDTVSGAGNLKTALKFAHPWFGPMDAAAWHFMTGFHMQLHRKQMELIQATLAKDGINR
jgi:DinB superfamily